MNRAIRVLLFIESVILILAGINLRLLFVIFIGLGFGLLWLLSKRLPNV